MDLDARLAQLTWYSSMVRLLRRTRIHSSPNQDTQMARKQARIGYVDGFVLVVPKRKLAAYRKIAGKPGTVWMKHGALDYKECVGDDLTPSAGGMPTLTFLKMTRVKAGETVVFSYVGYKSRAHCDPAGTRDWR